MTNLVFAVFLVVTNSYTNTLTSLVEDDSGKTVVAGITKARERVTQLWIGKRKPKVHLPGYDVTNRLAIISEKTTVLLIKSDKPKK